MWHAAVRHTVPVSRPDDATCAEPSPRTHFTPPGTCSPPGTLFHRSLSRREAAFRRYFGDVGASFRPTNLAGGGDPGRSPTAPGDRRITEITLTGPLGAAPPVPATWWPSFGATRTPPSRALSRHGDPMDPVAYWTTPRPVPAPALEHERRDLPCARRQTSARESRRADGRRRRRPGSPPASTRSPRSPARATTHGCGSCALARSSACAWARRRAAGLSPENGVPAEPRRAGSRSPREADRAGPRRRHRVGHRGSALAAPAGAAMTVAGVGTRHPVAPWLLQELET